jgi:hypothetical protein
MKVCASNFEDGTWIEELGSCSECGGEGFIDKSSQQHSSFNEYLQKRLS